MPQRRQTLPDSVAHDLQWVAQEEHRKSKRDRTGKELTNRGLRDNRRIILHHQRKRRTYLG